MKRILLLFLAAAALWACRPSQPLVGISSGRSATGLSTLSPNYPDAILRAGGVPVIFPTIDTEEAAKALVASVDAVVFSGGPDLDPSYYGETVWNETVKVVTLRDVSDLLLMRAALSAKKPIMAICRGEQLMAVAFGGSLWQDIPSQIPESYVKHRQGGTTGSYGTHSITIEKDSFLEKALGTRSTEVNSFHHQAIKDVPQGFKVIARSADGIIEGVERVEPLKNYPDGGGMIIATQFHPEALVTGQNKIFKGIFEMLVKEAAKTASK